MKWNKKYQTKVNGAIYPEFVQSKTSETAVPGFSGKQLFLTILQNL